MKKKKDVVTMGDPLSVSLTTLATIAPNLVTLATQLTSIEGHLANSVTFSEQIATTLDTELARIQRRLRDIEQKLP